MSRIGLSNVVYAPLTSDGVGGTTYGPVENLIGAAVANINPNSSAATDFLDDGPADTAVTLGQGEFNLEIGEIETMKKAFLLGNDYVGGVMLRKGDAVPPWVAVGFRSLKSNGEYRYKWLYKVKFREPEDTNETKGESINFQHDMMIGSFVKLESNNNWQAEADSDDPNVPAATITNWFTSVYGITADTTAPTFTSVPAAGATGVAVDVDVVVTFDEPMDINTFTNSNVIFIDAVTGVSVPFSLVKGSTSLTITPDANLDAATDYQVILSTAITDLSGNGLATPGVIDFTTA